MPDMMVLVAGVSQRLEPTPLRERGQGGEAMLSMSGLVTMRSLSHWSGKGGSDRTVHGFFMPACTGVISTGSSCAILCWTPMMAS